MFANHRAISAVGILVALLLIGAGGAEDKPVKAKAGLDKLQGVWTRDGQVWVITGDEILEYSSARGVTKKGKFKLDSTKKPKQIDINFESVSKGQPYSTLFHGIYELDGDTLKLCMASTYSPRTNSRTPRPTEFEKVAGVSQIWAYKLSAVVAAKADKIRETFLENEALADETYTHRMVKVSGQVRRVQRDGGNYEVLLSSKTVPLLFRFDGSVRSRLAKLKTGESVTMQGFCIGRSKRKGDSGDEAITFVGGKIIEVREGEPD